MATSMATPGADDASKPQVSGTAAAASRDQDLAELHRWRELFRDQGKIRSPEEAHMQLKNQSDQFTNMQKKLEVSTLHCSVISLVITATNMSV